MMRWLLRTRRVISTGAVVLPGAMPTATILPASRSISAACTQVCAGPAPRTPRPLRPPPEALPHRPPPPPRPAAPRRPARRSAQAQRLERHVHSVTSSKLSHPGYGVSLGAVHDVGGPEP